MSEDAIPFSEAGRFTDPEAMRKAAQEGTVSFTWEDQAVEDVADIMFEDPMGNMPCAVVEFDGDKRKTAARAIVDMIRLGGVRGLCSDSWKTPLDTQLIETGKELSYKIREITDLKARLSYIDTTLRKWYKDESAPVEHIVRSVISVADDMKARLEESNYWRTNYAQAVKDAEKERDAAIARAENAEAERDRLKAGFDEAMERAQGFVDEERKICDAAIRERDEALASRDALNQANVELLADRERLARRLTREQNCFDAAKEAAASWSAKCNRLVGLLKEAAEFMRPDPSTKKFPDDVSYNKQIDALCALKRRIDAEIGEKP